MERAYGKDRVPTAAVTASHSPSNGVPPVSLRTPLGHLLLKVPLPNTATVSARLPTQEPSRGKLWVNYGRGINNFIMARYTVNREQGFNHWVVLLTKALPFRSPQENMKGWWCSSVVQFSLSPDKPLDSFSHVLLPPQEENITTTNLTKSLVK